jgi:predicted nucleic acid-binding protein
LNHFVLDSSVTLAWFFEDEDSPYALSVRDRLPESSAEVAVIWPLEIANVLLIAERKGRISVAKSTKFLRELRELPINIDLGAAARNPQPITTLARTHSLTSYDAAYLELALRLGLPLATLDEPLRAAARNTGVPLYLEDSVWTVEAE